jgi:hypothetical protein
MLLGRAANDAQLAALHTFTQATRQLLLSSSPILQQSGMLRKLLLGGGSGSSGGSGGSGGGTAVAEGPSDAVLQSLLVYGMPGDAKAAQDAWTDILGASSPQQVRSQEGLLAAAWLQTLPAGTLQASRLLLPARG